MFTARTNTIVADSIGKSKPDGSSEYLDELSAQILRVRQEHSLPSLPDASKVVLAL